MYNFKYFKFNFVLLLWDVFCWWKFHLHLKRMYSVLSLLCSNMNYMQLIKEILYKNLFFVYLCWIINYLTIIIDLSIFFLLLSIFALCILKLCFKYMHFTQYIFLLTGGCCHIFSIFSFYLADIICFRFCTCAGVYAFTLVITMHIINFKMYIFIFYELDCEVN